MSFYYYPTSATAAGNGISYVTAADLDQDNIIDYVYAGDAKGNLWRFDFTSSNPMAWAAPAAPLFTTPGNQPITTQIVVAAVPANTGPPRVMLDFGTGQEIPFTNTNAATYASGAQALYGIWDWNMGGSGGWNTKGSTQYASLAGPQTITAASLATQTISTNGTIRQVTSNPVCWHELDDLRVQQHAVWLDGGAAGDQRASDLQPDPRARHLYREYHDSAHKSVR